MNICVIGAYLDRLYVQYGVCVLTDSDSVCTAWGTAMNIGVLRTDLDRSTD